MTTHKRLDTDSDFSSPHGQPPSDQCPDWRPSLSTHWNVCPKCGTVLFPTEACVSCVMASPTCDGAEGTVTEPLARVGMRLDGTPCEMRARSAGTWDCSVCHKTWPRQPSRCERPSAPLKPAPDAMREALTPFATFGRGEGITPNGLMRDRICDWFGPSDFDAAYTALTNPPIRIDRTSIISTILDHVGRAYQLAQDGDDWVTTLADALMKQIEGRNL